MGVRVVLGVGGLLGGGGGRVWGGTGVEVGALRRGRERYSGWVGGAREWRREGGAGCELASGWIGGSVGGACECRRGGGAES